MLTQSRELLRWRVLSKHFGNKLQTKASRVSLLNVATNNVQISTVPVSYTR